MRGRHTSNLQRIRPWHVISDKGNNARRQAEVRGFKQRGAERCNDWSGVIVSRLELIGQRLQLLPAYDDLYGPLLAQRHCPSVRQNANSFFVCNEAGDTTPAIATEYLGRPCAISEHPCVDYLGDARASWQRHEGLCLPSMCVELADPSGDRGRCAPNELGLRDGRGKQLWMSRVSAYYRRVDFAARESPRQALAHVHLDIDRQSRVGGP